MNSSNPESYRYFDLVGRKEKGKATIECRSSYDDVEVDLLLHGFVQSYKEHSDRHSGWEENEMLKDIHRNTSKTLINSEETRENTEEILSHHKSIKGLLGSIDIRLGLLKLEKTEMQDWKNMLQEIQQANTSKEEAATMVSSFDVELKEMIEKLPAHIHAYIKEADEYAAQNATDFMGPLKVRLSIPFLIGKAYREVDMSKFNNWVDKGQKGIVRYTRRKLGIGPGESGPALPPRT
jgi:hypothetical protein